MIVLGDVLDEAPDLPGEHPGGQVLVDHLAHRDLGMRVSLCGPQFVSLISVSDGLEDIGKCWCLDLWSWNGA